MASGSAMLNNRTDKYYFSGRSDNFGPAQSSLNPANAGLDLEALRVSKDGRSVFVAYEYDPYVYQFDRISGKRIDTFALPSTFGIANLSTNSATEISGNTSGRVANKGMEGLAITPEGTKLIGFMQSPLLQDGGDGGQANRIVTTDIAAHQVKQFACDNKVGTKNYNSSELFALNDHQFLVLERDGKRLGDGSSTSFKSLYMVDLTGAEDVSSLNGQAALLAKAPVKTLFLDIKSALNATGITSDKIPAKLEGLAFGADVVLNGVLTHTLYVANDNDFIATTTAVLSNPNQWYVFGVTDAYLTSYSEQQIAAIPEPQTWALLLAGVGMVGWLGQRRGSAARSAARSAN